jgi:hypothetical protein
MTEDTEKTHGLSVLCLFSVVSVCHLSLVACHGVNPQLIAS